MKSFSFLSLDEVRRVRVTLEALRGDWRFGIPDVFAYLGAPYWFLRDKKQPDEIARTNPLLRERFGWLYAKVEACLASELGAPTAYSDARAYPGFHLFFAKRSARTTHLTGTTMHWDYPTFRLMKTWDPPLPEYVAEDRCVSFTLPITTPASGASLVYWPDSSAEQMDRLARTYGHTHAAKVVAAITRPQVEEYLPGHLVIHNGHLLHCPGPFRAVEDGERRVTLQGHAFRFGDRWEIYW